MRKFLVGVLLLCGIGWGLWLGFHAPSVADDVPLSQEALSQLNMAEAPAPDPLVVAAPAPAGPGPELRIGGITSSRIPSMGVPRPAVLGPGRQRELGFVSQHDAELLRYQRKLHGITQRYQKKYPIVREVDQAFGGLSRYRTVRRRYFKDRDAYQWARDTIALPEVRQTIRRYAANPQVWKAAIGMMTEALKDPPPKAIYKEMQRFLTTDKGMIGFLEAFSKDVGQNLPNILMSLPPDTDLRPIQKLAEDLAPPSARAAMRQQSKRPAAPRSISP